MHQGLGTLTRIANFSYLMSMLDLHPPMLFLASGSTPWQSTVHGKAFIVLLCKPSKLHPQEFWFRPKIRPFYIYVGNGYNLIFFLSLFITFLFLHVWTTTCKHGFLKSLLKAALFVKRSVNYLVQSVKSHFYLKLVYAYPGDSAYTVHVSPTIIRLQDYSTSVWLS